MLADYVGGERTDKERQYGDRDVNENTVEDESEESEFQIRITLE